MRRRCRIFWPAALAPRARPAEMGHSARYAERDATRRSSRRASRDHGLLQAIARAREPDPRRVRQRDRDVLGEFRILRAVRLIGHHDHV